ncbi:MAG: Rpn family recombination-promoting nuclease/putative transposase [Lachnospiraceae bacterium]|nr:Rpn family recombination-promoting nuclease/putative transposase [Lachnospiraceae bacterium]
MSKTYEELDFTDDFLFCKILTENEKLCIEIAELITGRRISSLVNKANQKSVKATPDGKGVRFDVYFEDDKSVIYDLEMQNSLKPNLPRRTRFYQGMIDRDNLLVGENYEQIKESYVIFICLDDFFEKGRHIYIFENVCLEDTSIHLNDGAHKIFICAKGYMDDCSDKMNEFLSFLVDGKNHGELTGKLITEVENSKQRERWKGEYMLLEEKYREKFNEGREEGLREGEVERAKLADEILRLKEENKRLKEMNK